MSLKDLDPASGPHDWDAEWRSIFDHYQQDVRHAYYIRAILHRSERRLLEIGAGSFRDMASLSHSGLDCHGMDFSPESVRLAKERFPDLTESLHLMSAFSLDFEKCAFDFSYHNGFWVLFDDQHIRALALEQARVTRFRMVATVHNAHNRQFVDYFERMKTKDPLYDVRFFEVDEMMELMQDTCSEVSVIPVGKGKRHHEDFLIRIGITDPLVLKTYLRASGMRFLERSERLMCIGTVR